MSVFVGIDLAWTAQRESGVCVLLAEPEGLRLGLLESVVTTPETIVERLAELGPDVVVAVDAPLVISEEREAEALLARKFGRFGAYAYSANRGFLERIDGMAGPRLGSLLAHAGFSLDPAAIKPHAEGRFAFEMYPHAAQVVLLGLPRILRYKRGRVAERREALDVYRCCLAQLADALALESPVLDEVLWAPLADIPARDLKPLEDRLDAFTCALTAYEAWQHGVAAHEVFGTPEHGAIAVPGMARDERFN